MSKRARRWQKVVLITVTAVVVLGMALLSFF